MTCSTVKNPFKLLIFNIACSEAELLIQRCLLTQCQTPG